MKLKKVIAAVTAAALAIGSLTAYSIVSPKFSLSAEAEPEEGKIIVDTEENSGLAFAFYDRAEDASGEPIEEIEDETNKYAVEANTEILAVVTLPEALEDGKKLSVFYGGESESFFENDKITFSFSFTMPEEGIVVGAEIKDPDIYNIIVTVEDGGTGSVTINGQDASEGVQAAENSEVIVEAEPAEGYEVGSIMVITDRETFGIDSGDSFVMPSGDVEVRVTFVEKSERKYTITNIPYNSVVTVNGIETDRANARANAGDTVTLIVNEYREGCKAKVILFNEIHLPITVPLTPDSNNENIFTFIMPECDVYFYLSFVFLEYKVNTIITNPEMGSAYVWSGISAETDTFVEETGSLSGGVSILAVPEEGYRLDTITVVDSDNNSVEVYQDSNDFHFGMPTSDVTVTVSFTERDSDAQTYMINTADTVNGSVAVNSEAEEGEKISIRCVPDDGYAINSITVTTEDGETYSYNDFFDEPWYSYYYIKALACSSESYLLSFDMPASNVTVSVSFVKIYKIDWTPSRRAGITGKLRAIDGQPVRLDVSTATGYIFEDCSVIDSDGNAVDIYTDIEEKYIYFYMPASDVTVIINTKKIDESDNEHNITITPAENGSIRTCFDETADYEGDAVGFFVSPNEGYSIDSCSVTDSYGNAVCVYMYVQENIFYFFMPDSDVTITVTFKEADPDEPDPEETPTETEAPVPEVTSSETETPAPEVTPSETETPAPEVTPSETETPVPEVTPSETEAPTPEVTSSETEIPAPEEPPSETEPPVHEETTPSTETPDPAPDDTSEDLTIDIDEENKITGNNVIRAGGNVKPGETVDITDENSDASASVKLPDNAESGLSFIITNKTDEIIDSANRILAEAAKIAAEKAKAIKSTIENILNNKSKGFAYELKFTDSSGNTAKVEGAFVKAALPIPENLLPENTGAASFFVYHATANGFEKIDSIFNAANNTVEFAATSFSPYLITLEEITGGESENTASTSNIPSFVIPALTLSSTEAAGTGSVTAAPIPTASSTSSVSTTVPPAAADVSPETNATPIDSADNMGKPDSESTADAARDSSGTSGMGFADTNAATGLALELIPLLSVTAIGIFVSMKKK